MTRLRTLSLVFTLAAALVAPTVAHAENTPPSISDEAPMLVSDLAVAMQQRDDVDMQKVGALVTGALQAVPQSGAAPVSLSPEQHSQLSGMVQAAFAGDPQALAALNQFPGWNVPALGQALEAELAAIGTEPGAAPAPTSVTEPLGIPVADQRGPVSTLRPLGYGLWRGTAYDPAKSERYADSKRLAEVLNRLSLNGTGWVTYGDQRVRTPRGVLAMLAADGHMVEAYDHRSIANFMALYYQAPGSSELREVAAALWLDTQVPVPGTERTLLVPATHSEVVFTVRGPVVNADVAFFLGSDNEATFRPTASARPSWTGTKVLRRFKGDEALRAASAAAWVRRNMERLTARRRLGELRTGAYGQLGVCNDATALVEAKMGLEATHWPLVRLPEVWRRGTGMTGRISDRVPYDTDPAQGPDVERVLQSIPWEVDAVPTHVFPALAADVQAVAAASGQGILDVTQGAFAD